MNRVAIPSLLTLLFAQTLCLGMGSIGCTGGRDDVLTSGNITGAAPVIQTVRFPAHYRLRDVEGCDLPGARATS
jgi:hypothetical protein